MLTEKSNLLQRVRVVMIALVAVIGFGTMAMKPVEPLYAHTYGVAKTAAGLDWQIVADVTDQTPNDYDCSDAANSLCTIYTDATLAIGQTVPITPGQPGSPGRFNQ